MERHIYVYIAYIVICMHVHVQVQVQTDTNKAVFFKASMCHKYTSTSDSKVKQIAKSKENKHQLENYRSKL